MPYKKWNIDFESLTENTPLTIYLLGTDGYFKFVNKQMSVISGYSKEELFKIPFSQLIHPQDREDVIKQFAKRIKGEKALTSYEFRGITKDGRIRYLRGFFDVIEVKDEKWVLGQVLDITEKKKMEKELRRREEAYRKVLNISNLGYFEVDLAGNFIYVNNVVPRILGYSKEELMGLNNRDYSDPDTAKRVYKIFNTVYKQERPHAFFEWTLKRKDGKEVYVETSVDLIYDEEGNKKGFRGIMRDITHEKQMKRELREREEYYRIIFEGSGTAMIIVREDHTISRVNHKFEKISGYKREELEGKIKWTEFVHERDLPRMLSYNRMRKIDPKSVPREYEFTFLDRWKNKKYMLVNVSLLPGGRILGSFTDITSRKELEKKLLHLSFHDALTGIYNRCYFEEELTRLENNRNLPVALIIADLDGLKQINDTLGHKIGDKYIKESARILRNSVRKSDVVARIGGDEFGIILPSSDEDTVKRVINRIQCAVDDFNSNNEKEFKINISFGFAISARDKLDKDLLFREADKAMYKNKQQRKAKARCPCTR